MAGKTDYMCFVAPYFCSGSQHPDLVPVRLPDDIGKFVLIDDYVGGFDVQFHHRRRWCSLAGDVWMAKCIGSTMPTWAPRIGVVYFGRNILRKLYSVREMNWKEWEKRR